MVEQAISLPQAASVVLLRESDGPDPFEVYMMRRPDDAKFAPGLYTFPGGVLDATDYTIAEKYVVPLAEGLTVPDVHQRMQALPNFVLPREATTGALLVCGVRELFEETGILVARQSDGALATLDNEARWADLRQALLAETVGFGAILRDDDLTIAPDDLIYFGHWITPPTSPIRFDTHFFIAQCPPGQVATHWSGEMVAGEWFSPQVGLARNRRGEVPLWQPQSLHLERFTRYDSLAALFEHGRTKAVPAVLSQAHGPDATPEFIKEFGECW